MTRPNRTPAAGLAALVCAGLLVLPGRAEPPRPARGKPPPKAAEKPRYPAPVRKALEQARRFEVVQMLSAIAKGSQMGPGDGWFRPGQGRYDWKWLAAHFDADKDGKVTPKELKGPKELFERLDRDRDGAVRPGDLDWSDKSPFLQQLRQAQQLAGRLDTSSNGRITREEWDALFKKAAKGKDHLTPEDLREALLATPPRPAKPPKNAEPSPRVLLAGLLSGELGSFLHGPDVGGRAPNFTLKMHDGSRTISLSDYRGKKPVVLIFGSFT
jgi:hypothetical protein